MVNGIINACQPNRNLRNLHGSGSDPVRLPILLGYSETSPRVITRAQANASRAAFLHIPTMKVACCQYIANILMMFDDYGCFRHHTQEDFWDSQTSKTKRQTHVTIGTDLNCKFFASYT